MSSDADPATPAPGATSAPQTVTDPGPSAAPVPAAVGATAPAAGPKPRGRQTAADMVRSLGLVGIMVALIFVVVLRPQPDPVRAVDWRPIATAVAAGSPVPVLVPEPVPAGWVATSAALRPVTGGIAWTLGFVTAEEEFAGVAVTDATRGAAAQGLGLALTAAGTTTVAGEPWDTWRTQQPDDTVLSRTTGDATVLVYGSAPPDQLQDLATRLVPVRPEPAP